jgi:hypothetical protein
LFVVKGFSPLNIIRTSEYARFLNTFRNRHITQTAEACPPLEGGLLQTFHLFVVMGFSPSNIVHTSEYARFLNTFRNRHITQTAEAVCYKLSTCS